MAHYAELRLPSRSQLTSGLTAGTRACASGRRVIVDVDLEKLFDRVNFDVLIDELEKKRE